MKSIYSIVEILNSDLVGITSDEWGQQLWCRSRLQKYRKGRPQRRYCVVCGLPMEKTKSDYGFRPITNKSNRMERICINCIEDLIYEAMKKKTIK